MEFTGERFVPGKTELELEQEHLNRYRFARQFVKGKRVLDAACGVGYGTAELAQDAAYAVGIDIDADSISYAKENYGSNTVHYQVASIEKLPFDDNTFDVVISFETLEHVSGTIQRRFLAEIKRVLTQNGVLVMSTPNRDIYGLRGNNEFHVCELSYQEFNVLLEDFFPNVQMFTQENEVCNAISGVEQSLAEIENDSNLEDAEYLIAVCSQMEILPIVSRTILRNDNRYRELLDWAVNNHHELIRKNEFIRETEIQQAANENRIQHLLKSEDALQERVEQLQETVLNKEIYIQQLLASEQDLQNAIKEKEKQIQQLQQTIQNKEGHIALLLESDRELERIKTSRSWRFMGYVWKLRDILIPQGSRRRLLAKMLVKFIKHPIQFLKKCTPSRIAKFFKTLRREGVEGTARRLDDCLIGNTIPVQRLSIESLVDAPQKTAADYMPITVPQWDKPQVSIVLPVYNQFDYTYLCVQSIVKNSGDVSYEILLADDCSTDLTKDIAQIISGLHIVRNKENLRFLRNCNNAAQHAKGDYILFLNNDTQVQPNWLQPLVELIERDEKNGMVGSKLVYPDGRLQEAGGIVWKDASAWNYGHGANPDAPEYNYVKEVDYISGAAIMIRRTLWKEIGGFDELFVPAYYEDTDLAFEVRRHGYKVLYQPLSVVVHFEGVSNGTDLSSGQKIHQIRNRSKFYEKWKNTLENEHYDNAVEPFVTRECGRGRKYLLMVDHYVPMFDKDAGSRCVYQYIQLFVDLGYHVKFIGDNFYPHQPYTQVLQQMGVEVLYGPYYANHWKDWLQENGKHIGYAFLNRPHIAVNYIDLVHQYTPAKIAYFGHDLHFLREKREYEVTGNVQTLKSAESWKEKELALMRKADVAYYPSCVEEQIIHEIDRSINVKAIPLNMFKDTKNIVFDAEQRKDMLFIGGFGHSPNVDAVKWMAKEILPRLVELLPDIVVHILGSNPPEEIKSLASEHMKIHGFVTDEELAEFYRNCRLDIIPLRYGAGIKGKVIEAMQYGMPVVTTSIGAEGIAGAENILLIEDDAQVFAEKAAALYLDAEELQHRSSASTQYVRGTFSPESVIRVIGEDFDMV